MRHKPIQRAPDAFQQPVTGDQIKMMIRRAFGPVAHATEAVELGGGLWNTTLRVEGNGFPGPVIIRVAPAPQAQTANERNLMWTEHAVLPFLTGLGELVPRLLFADFTRQALPRDYLVQTLLPGVPAPEAFTAWEPGKRAGFYRQLGDITWTVHTVAGPKGFGRVGGQLAASWSEHLLAEFTDLVQDLEAAGLDAADLRQVAGLCETHAHVLDQITVPRLTLGDLWVPNVMVNPATLDICGVFDTDRAVWGDPLADWTVFQAGQKPGSETDAFWEAYGRPARDADAQWRAHLYAARHWGAIRLERHRLRRAGRVPATYDAITETLANLR